MRKKADQILRRIPDRHERFAPSMIDRFKYSPSPSPFLSPTPPVGSKPRLLNGNSFTSPNSDTKPLIKQNGIPAGAIPGTSLDGDTAAGGGGVGGGEGLAGGKNDSLAFAPIEPQTKIHAGVTNVLFEDRPALERTAEGMAAFVGFDAAMEEFLDSWDPSGGMKIAGTSSSDPGGGGAFGMGLSDGRPRSSSGGLPVLDVNARLRQLADEDDELAVWKIVMEDPLETSRRDSIPPEVDRTDSSESGADTKKRKRWVWGWW
jgi:hypothetical protein